MYEGIAILKGSRVIGYDEHGNALKEESERPVYVQPRSVYASEFYKAAQAGMAPSLTLYMTNRADYKGEKIAVFDGVEYKIIRTDWKPQRDGINLICEERIKNG